MKSVHVRPWYKPRLPRESELKEMLLRERLDSKIVVMEPDEGEEVHEHLHDEIDIVLRGNIEFCAEGRCRVLKPGDRIDIRKATPHTTKALGDEPVVLISAVKK
jgi:quercetin dioxygenase-like cupin family protein